MRIQCASITSTLCCAEPNSCVHVDFKWPHLHTATMAPSSDLYFSQPSYCFSSWADTWSTVCSPEKRAHCQYSTHECACHAIFGPHVQRAIARSRSIRIETTSGSGLGLIRIGSGLGECAFSVDALKPDSIRFNVHWVSSVDRPLDIKQTTKGPGCSHLSQTLCLLYYFL